MRFPSYRFHLCCALRTAMLERVPSAECKKDGQQQSVSHRPLDVRLHSPVIVEHTRTGAEVNQTVKHLPPAATQTDDPFSCGRDGQGQHQNKTEETGNDERTLQKHVFENCVKVEILIEPDISCQMNETVEEREQAQHPAEADERAPSSHPPQWGYAQGKDQKAERPDTCPIADIFQRIRAQAPRKRIEQKPHYGYEASEKNNRLENPPATKFGHYGLLLASGPPST